MKNAEMELESVNICVGHWGFNGEQAEIPLVRNNTVVVVIIISSLASIP